MSKKASSTIGPLTRSAGGNAMFNNNDIQFFNRFVKEDFTDIPEDKATSFKAFMEAENEKKKRQAKLEVVKESQKPVILQAPHKYDKFNNSAKATISGDTIPAEVRGEYAPGPDTATPGETKTIERVRKVYIDSSNRNVIEYPDIADFQIFLGRTFENVTRIKLIDMQFPNVDPAINLSNNRIYWVNQEDMTLDEEKRFFNYLVQVKVGSYNYKTLVTQMTSALNNVNVKRRAGTGRAHYYIIDINRETDLVSFTSIYATPADSNPIYTTQGNGFIRVKQTNHGYENEPGKRTIIHVIGVRGNVGGIPAAELNGAFSITVIDRNNFSFEVATPATSTTIGGGSYVKTGKEAPFQFLFGQYPNTIADVLGFPVENSSDPLDESDPLTSMIKPLTSPNPYNLNDAVEEGEPTIIWCEDHGLAPGDKIFLHNFFVQPSIYEDDKHKGIFEVHEVLSDDRFSIDWYTQRISDVSRAYVGTQLLHMFWDSGHGFNEIADISEVPADSGIIQVTTKWPNKYKTGEGILLTRTNSVPPVDGFHPNITVLSDDTFTFTWYETPDDPVNSSLLHLTTPGTKGILTTDHTFYLYNVQPFGGFSASDLNNSPFTVRKIINERELLFTTNYGFSDKAEQGGGLGIRINSKIHGWRGTQTNTVGDSVYKPVDLSGANYCYLCTPNIRNDAVVSTGPVKNIFAKLYLPLPPGNYIFDEFDSTPIEFEKPIPRLDMMRFSVMSPQNNKLEFAGLDYSFALEITELVQVDDKNNVSSKMAA